MRVCCKIYDNTFPYSEKKYMQFKFVLAIVNHLHPFSRLTNIEILISLMNN